MRSTPPSCSASSARCTRVAVVVLIGSLCLEGVTEPLQRLPVALHASSGHVRQAQLADDRLPPPRLAPLDVGEVNLHRGQAGQLQGVADRVGVVGPRPGVEDEPVGQALEAVQALHELALVVGVEEPHLEPQLGALGLDLQLELLEAHRSVVGWVAASELIEVDSVHDLDSVPDATHGTNSRTAETSARGGTWHPGRTSPGRSSSTNGTLRSPRRFLSRAVAITTASGSAPSSRVGRPRAASSSCTSARSSAWPERRSAARRPSATASPWR